MSNACYMDINTAKNRTEIYAIAKAEGITLSADIKRQLNVGGLKDFVRAALAAR